MSKKYMVKFVLYTLILSALLVYYWYKSNGNVGNNTVNTFQKQEIQNIEIDTNTVYSTE